MALVFPLSADAFINELQVETAQFYSSRMDSSSRTRGGAVIAINRTDPFWMASITCALGSLEQSARAEAFVESVGVNSFYMYNVQRPFPASDPRGISLQGTSPTLHTIGSNNRSLRITGLPSSFQLSIGDMLAYSSNGVLGLHRVREDAVATAPGLTPLFEVTPHLKSGISTGAAVALVRPSVLMKIDWSTYEPPTGKGPNASGMSFSAYEARL